VGTTLALALATTGCNLAPAYDRPKLTGPQPAVYKEMGPWTAARPDDAAPRGAWWAVFRDPILDGLERQVETANPTLAADIAAYDQARAFAAEASAQLLPAIGASGSPTLDRQSVNRPLRGGGEPNNYSVNTLSAQGYYEIDFWGRIRNLVAAGRAEAQASAADLAVAKLGLQAELANDYLSLRGLDAQARLLDQTVAAYDKALNLTEARHNGGAASGLDVDRATTQLSSVKAQVSDLAAHRALYEHAIASLIGRPASSFSLPPAPESARTPVIPAGVPSELLQRRPDIAAAERRAFEANRRIGVARAAFYPTISLNPQGGFQNTGELNLLTVPNSFWTVGPQFAFQLFDGGYRHAAVTAARAQFMIASGDYRATVLRAFQQVEDQLALANHYSAEAADESDAVRAAQATTHLSLVRYREGATNYLEVVIAQAAELQAEETALSLETARQQASVNLVLALGGGWTASDLPSPAQASRLHAPPPESGS
jgi:NodT family efflux transporter outer membrane factor (OMF) lipoprotein